MGVSVCEEEGVCVLRDYQVKQSLSRYVPLPGIKKVPITRGNKGMDNQNNQFHLSYRQVSCINGNTIICNGLSRRYGFDTQRFRNRRMRFVLDRKSRRCIGTVAGPAARGRRGIFCENIGEIHTKILAIFRCYLDSFADLVSFIA